VDSCIYPRTGTGDWLLWARCWTFGFCKMRGIYWLVKELLAFWEGLYSMGLVGVQIFDMWVSNQLHVGRFACDRPVSHILYMGLRRKADLGAMVVTSFSQPTPGNEPQSSSPLMVTLWQFWSVAREWVTHTVACSSSTVWHIDSPASRELWQHNHLTQCFQNFLPAEPFGLRQITADPHILAHVNIVCMDDDRYTELKLYISELILDCSQYIPAAYVTMHCMILL
jgi:hypothetical protein